MTDFSPNRPHRWPASSVKAFEVHHLGDTEADIREGQDVPKLWAKWHYDWSTPGTVELTAVESDSLAPGSRMSMTARPAGSGSDVHVVWDQTAQNVTATVGVFAMRFVGPWYLARYFRKVFDGLAD
jgi:hypothetical protein